MNLVRMALATCGGLGLAPRAPGTVGTLGGVLIAWGLSGSERYLMWSLVCALGIFLVGRTLGAWAQQHSGTRDPAWFVLDEVAGYLLAVAWVTPPSSLALLTAFWAFRFFDIVKPPPARWLERLGGGNGMMLDDVAAAAWAFAVVMLPLRLWLDVPWAVQPGI